MRNQTICICEKDADRSAVSAQLISVFFLLYIRHKASSFHIRNSKSLGICGCTVRFMLEMVGNYAHLFVVCQLKLVCSKFPLSKYFDFSSNYVQ